MRETYKAILRGDRIEWSGDAPEQLDTEQGVEVQVTILQSPATSSAAASNGKAMAEVLEKLAATNSVSEISDASTWQREQRQDRVLPGRDA
jgi:hypothetical protein